MNRLNQILACLVSLVMLLLVVEGGLRLLGFSPRPTMNVFDAKLGWTKQPNAEIRRSTSEFDVTLATNSRGLRELESVGYEKPSGVERILLVGDSFTLGYTVDRPDTISALLERRLRAEGRDVQVVNAGTEGYSTDQEALWLGHEGKRYTPDVVVLQMYENDIYWNGQDHYLRYPKPKLTEATFETSGDVLAALPDLEDPGLEPWLVRRTALGSLLAKTIAPPEVPMLEGKGLPAEWGPRLSDDAAGLRETALALRVFRDVAERIGAAPLVLVIPDKAQIDPAARAAMTSVMGDPAYDPARPFRHMLAAARANGLATVDPSAALERASQGGRVPLYFQKDWHTNAVGNEVLAEALATALAAPALLGPPSRAVAEAVPVAPPAAESRLLRSVAIGVAIALVLGTLYWRRFPAEGPLRSYGLVAALVGFVAGVFVLLGWLAGLLPPAIGRWVSTVVVVAVLGAVVWYLRKRVAVMAELFGTFVRRGQWYMLPVLTGLLTIGALLVVAASSPWLAPFIYTLF
jgi:lysophospholipase L1-like esterase